MHELMAKIEADNRNIVNHDTFGHLYPTDKEVHKGKICAAHGDWGDIVLISESVEGIGDSPWWFASLNEFVTEAIKSDEYGVFVFDVEAQVVDEEPEWDEDEEEWVESSESRIVITEKSRTKVDLGMETQ